MFLSRIQRLGIGISLAVSLLVLLAPSSCTLLRETVGLGPVRPQVALVSIEISKMSVQSIDLLATLRVDNPNEFALTFRNLLYHLAVDATFLAEGRYADTLQIAAREKKLVRLPIRINAANAIKLVRQFLQSEGSPVATLSATANFVTPLGDMRVNIEEKKPLAKLAGF